MLTIAHFLTLYESPLAIYTGASMSVCKMKVLHIGSNLPGVNHPDVGFKSVLNTSEINYENRLVPDAQASMTFHQLTNWGK